MVYENNFRYGFGVTVRFMQFETRFWLFSTSYAKNPITGFAGDRARKNPAKQIAEPGYRGFESELQCRCYAARESGEDIFPFAVAPDLAFPRRARKSSDLPPLSRAYLSNANFRPGAQ